MKKSQDLKSLDMSTLFRKFTKHEHELKRFEASESNAKLKENNKEVKKNISLKASTSKAKLEDAEDNTSERFF